MGEVNIGESAHGLGKLFYPNGKLMFEGQFFRGKRHGYGRDFYPNGALSYQVPVQLKCYKLVKNIMSSHNFTIVLASLFWGLVFTATLRFKLSFKR